MNKPPNVFLVAGMPRAGTTYLYHMFLRHPGVFAPARKELDYFSFRYRQGAPAYERFFNGMVPGQIGCDISPFYVYHEEALSRIVRDLPQAKVILAVRRPAEFAVSWYKQISASGREVPPFVRFIEAPQIDHLGQRFEVELHGKDALRNRIPAFCTALGGRLLIYSFESFKRDPLRIVRLQESFLRLAPFFSEENIESRRINTSHRRNVTLLSRLLSNERIVNLACTLLPRRPLASLRAAFDRASAGRIRPELSVEHDDMLQLAQATLQEDDRYVQTLFGGADVLLGDGRPFGLTARRAPLSRPARVTEAEERR